jgi:hypothetical protein
MGGGEAMTEAVEEQKRRRGGRGAERAMARRWERPARWGLKERRRVVKFTVQAAWIIRVVEEERAV